MNILDCLFPFLSSLQLHLFRILLLSSQEPFRFIPYFLISFSPSILCLCCPLFKLFADPVSVPVPTSASSRLFICLHNCLSLSLSLSARPRIYIHLQNVNLFFTVTMMSSGGRSVREGVQVSCVACGLSSPFGRCRIPNLNLNRIISMRRVILQ